MPSAQSRLRPALAFAAFTLVFTYVAVALALAKPFWHDEIYTILFADLPSVSTMWRAAGDGIDLAPPMNAMVTHGVHALLGTGRLATRLPALIGFWTMSLVVFELVRRRSHSVAALSAAMLPCLTEAFRYAVEARGYGLMLGLFAVAIWSWSEAARGRARTRHLVLLAAAIAAGLWNQYFAVLVLVPIAVGEAIRSTRARTIDWGVALAAACGLGAALPLAATMKAAAGQASTFWRHAEVGDIGATYALLYAPLLTKPVLVAVALAVVLVFAGTRFRNRARVDSDYRDVPAHEIGAALAMLALPVAAVLMGVFVTGVFVPRYALAGVIGMSLVLPLTFARIGSRRMMADLVLLTALVATFGASAYRAVIGERPLFVNPVDARPRVLQQLRRGEAVIVSGATEYLQLWYYAPRELRSQVVYLADPAAALQMIGTDTVDRNYLALRRWSPVAVRDYDEFVASHPSFVVYAAGQGWLLERLRERGAVLAEIDRETDGTLYRIHVRPLSDETDASVNANRTNRAGDTTHGG